jgi:hypothetical protein
LRCTPSCGNVAATCRNGAAAFRLHTTWPVGAAGCRTGPQLSHEEQKAKKAVEAVISKWSKTYVYHIQYLSNDGSKVMFDTIWSKLGKARPIPETVVHIIFTVRFSSALLSVARRLPHVVCCMSPLRCTVLQHGVLRCTVASAGHEP